MVNKSRFQEIKYNAKGEQYIIFKGKRHYINTFKRSQNEEYDGYKTMSNISALVIQISKCGDGAKVWII